MKNSFLIQYLSILSTETLNRLEEYLNSPYFNKRKDILKFFQVLKAQNLQEIETLPNKESVYNSIYSSKEYSNLDMNNLIAHLLKLVRDFMALEHYHNSAEAQAHHLLQTLRDYHLNEHFERTWQKTHEKHQENPLRNGSWYMQEYQLQNEWFKYQSIKSRSWPENIEQATTAFMLASALEIARWNRTLLSVKQTTGKDINLTLAEPSLAYLQANPIQIPAFRLIELSNTLLEKTSTAQDFAQTRALLTSHGHEISVEEKREVYLACINFCIRQINAGNRDFMQEAFHIYREGLENKSLLDRENEISTQTYYNIHVLAHRVGEPNWAKEFLDAYQIYLPREVRENYYKYNLAIYSFMLEDFQTVLDTLIQVRFNEIFLNVEVRTMMLRSYYETKSWNSLDSLLASFSLFVRRHQELAAYRNHYLNLIRYTKKLLKLNVLTQKKRKELLLEVQQTNALANKDWVIKKLQSSINPE